MIEFVPATAEHIRALFGRSLERTVRALAVIDGEKVLGIGGIYDDEGHTVVFAKLTDELRSHPRVVLLAARRVMGWLRGEAFALCDTNIPQARRFLEYLGFQRIQGEVYRWQIQ